MPFGEKLTRLRKREGLSQESLAENLGVSRQAVSRWEQGTALPDAAKLLPCARLFRVSVEWLLDETRDMTDGELRAGIARIAAEAGVELNGSQVGQLVTLCRALEKLDPDALREKVQSVQETLRGLGAALEKAGGFFQRVIDAVNSVIDFFRGLFT